MKETKKNEELQSRREFFKRAAKGVLPMLGVMAFGPTVLTSCGGGDDGGDLCSDCSASCSWDCDVTCSSTCTSSSANSSSNKGSGTMSDPFSASEAKAFAASLKADEISDLYYYIKGYISEIKEVSITYGNATYYISDTPLGSNELYIYRGHYIANSEFTSPSQIKIGDEVIIFGILTNYNGTTPETLGGCSYIYSLNGKTTLNDGSCSECASTCTASCYNTSSSSSSCSDCAINCSGGCSGSCSGGCTAGCGGGCGGGCTGGCWGCTGTCSTSCKGGCYHACSGTCSGMCGYGCGFGSK